MISARQFNLACEAFKVRRGGDYLSFAESVTHASSTAGDAAKCCRLALSGRNRLDEQNRCLRVDCTNGDSLALMLRDGVRIEAFAEVVNRVHFVCVNVGVASALWHLNLSIWTHSRFFQLLEKVSDETLLSTESVERPIPRGLEGPCVYAKGLVSTQDRLKWVQPAVRFLENAPQRMQGFRRSYMASLTWCWLHEVGHVLKGHTSQALDEFFPLSSLEIDEEAGFSLTREARLLAEMEADAYASSSLLVPTLRLNRRTSDRTIRDVAVITGTTAVTLLLSGVEDALGTTNFVRRHPPVWYRALQLSRIANSAFSRDEFPVTNRTLSDLSHLHHFFGDQLAATKSPHAISVAEQFRADVRKNAGDALEYFKQRRTTIAPQEPPAPLAD